MIPVAVLPWSTDTCPNASPPGKCCLPNALSVLLVLGEDALGFDVDRDLLADGDAAAGDRAVVADTEVVPVDLAGGGEACPGAAEGVRTEAVHLKLQGDEPGDTADRELAVKQEVVPVGADIGGAERHRRVRLDLEEVGAADVVVSVRLAGIHRAQVNGGSDAGLQRIRRGHDSPLEIVEAATDLAHHHVPDDERHFRVHGVDGPGPRDIPRNLYCRFSYSSPWYRDGLTDRPCQ